MADDFGFEAEEDYEAEFSGNEASSYNDDSQLSHTHEPTMPTFKAQLPQPSKPAPAASSSFDEEFGFDEADSNALFADEEGGSIGQQQQVKSEPAVLASSRPSLPASRSFAAINSCGRRARRERA